MTVINEGLPLNSNYIKFGLKKEGFQDPLSSFHSHLLKLFAMRFNHIYGFASLRRAYIATRITFSHRVIITHNSSIENMGITHEKRSSQPFRQLVQRIPYLETA